jgi:H+/Na+-translocating ferredoxin:NAD+ oxidoreductase subunit G
MTMNGPALPVRADVPAIKLVGTLALAGALAGMLIVTVFQWAQPRILAHQAQVLGEAIREVLHDPDHYQTLFVVDGALTADLAAGQDSTGLDRVYLGFDASGAPTGFAVVGAEPGFQDVIRLIFGYDADKGRLLGMKVLESKETPGLGDRIEKDTTFAAGFTGVLSPIRGVKKGAGTDKEDEIDMITGATISSRAVIGIINHRLEQIGPLLRQYHAGARQ